MATTIHTELDTVYGGDPLHITMTVHPPIDSSDAHEPFTFQSEMYVASEEVNLDIDTWGLSYFGVGEGIALLANLLSKLDVDIHPVEA